MINLASSLMAEYKAELSLANLDTVVFLFYQVFDRCPTAHPLHSDAVLYCTIPTDCSCHVMRYIYCSSDKLFMLP